ncbi:hypothetical protein HYH02_006226 [Chlamydomonas schloesseri]|uniref:U3 small nucleolar RNA-associated protein 6 n=1 Tax=Chlamydomonas schloesseri TaxID=2026947 RepID=A0A835WK49_9CHLO|nr:hypothetical protein HYH02_006226 [Chlamydomonas schloesseri]|eukprot:KAG2448877.1 hypothetical protein HYH02_006226 [Chlamydomonas schloesseri]
MADTVQYLMEQMIPELEDLEQKGYFTRAEVKKIVQKRQNFEYLLKRRAALKEDYYRYVDFEMKLEELRQARKAKKHIKGKKGLAEVAIVRRIHFIFERAGRKFRSDLSLWLRWIEVCKKYKSTKQLSKVITKALSRHSTVSALWIEAARWEFDTNNDMAAARSLMQQGLRICKADEEMWLQYYSLELLYALKLRVRRKVLGLDDLAADASGEAGAPSAAAVRAVMEGGVACIVFKNAVAALPARLGFRARFLDLLRRFEYGFVTGLLDQVYDSIQKDFGQSEEAWDLLARRKVDFPASGKGGPAATAQSEEAEADAAERQLQADGAAETGPGPAGPWDADAHAAACDVYEAALTALPGSRMHQLFAAFLCGALEQLMEAGAEGPGAEAAVAAAVGVAARLFGLLQRAHSEGHSTAETYLTWVEWAGRVGQPKMALKAARKGCERFPADVAMWRRRLQLEQAAAAGREEEHLLPVLKAALQATQPDQAAELWLLAVEVMPASSPEFGRLGDMLGMACAKVARKAPSGGLGHAAAALVGKAREALGLDAARALYGRLLAVPAPGGDLYRAALRIEEDAVGMPPASSSGSGVAVVVPAVVAAPKAAAKRVTDLYEAAVAAYGHSEADLWIGYARWVVAGSKGAGQVYWRATKTLAEPDAFVAAYRGAIGQQ